MQVTETVSEGLKRELQIVIPAADLNAKLDSRLVELKDQVRINGFRPGKVPIAHMKKVYGKQAMAEIVQEEVNSQSQKAIEERNEKAAMQPAIAMTEDEAEADEILNGKKDLDLTVTYEIMPEITLGDFSGIKVEKPVVEIADSEVDEQLNSIAENNRDYAEKKGKAKDGDRISMSYLGKVDGEPFEGGADENGQLVIGSGRFIPGFEEQLVGLKAGDEKVVEVTFPEDYQAAELAGKAATFDVVVKEVAGPGELKIDDEFATNLGLDSLDKLKEVIKEQIANQYAGASRSKVKRQLLDQLDELHSFELPPTMVEQEFNGIWTQVERDLEAAEKTFADEDTTEEKAREEYQAIAERRVRLGLVLSEIGDKNEIKVSEEEVRGAVMQRAQQYPGQEREVFEFFQKNPDQIAGLRAPIFEEKVVDYILELATVEEKTVTAEELLKEDEEDA